VASTSADGIYLSRHVSLKSGVRQSSPALTVNRLCGSGFESVVSASLQILHGDANLVLAGGAENMSQSPYIVRNVRFGTKFGSEYKFEDSLWCSLTDAYIKTPMGITAENLAEKYNISRQQVDEFALISQKRWAEAQKAGRFDAEIVGVPIKTKKGEDLVTKDEHPRPETTIEQLAKLQPVFKKGGTVTAGNASGISDGASAILVADETAIKKYNLTPLARIVNWGTVGVDPSIMGIGPVYAIQLALKKANLKLSDMDLIEVNEAFGSQYLAVEKELGLDRNKTNVNGGAIALGHPLGASGNRILAHLTHSLQKTKSKYAVGSACIGGGQGIAVILERV